MECALRLWLGFPQSAPEELGAVVVAPGRVFEVGFRVRFNSLSFVVRDKLDRLLKSLGGRGLAPQPFSERRLTDRAPARIEIAFASPHEFLVSYAENISQGGIFISMDNPPPLREIVELLVQLPDGGPPARTFAEVTHRTDDGAGLQFVGADDSFRAPLDLFIHNLL